MAISDSSIVLRRDVAGDGCTFWHLCDKDGHTIWPFVDYIIDCVDVSELNPKTIENRAYALVKWFRFLLGQRLGMWDVTDATLKLFRNELMEKRAANCGKSLQARRRSINLDLRNVYMFYAWLQQDPGYGADRRLLGSHQCQIMSTLMLDTNPRDRNRQRYPLTFAHAGERSKHRLGFVPGESHRSALTAYFYDTFPSHLALRNCLIFELAWSVGWRRGSILSLTVTDFAAARAQPHEDFSVTPAHQKFGYSNSFDLPGRMVVRLLDFIDKERADCVARTRSSRSEIFLNDRTGQPLTAGAVSTLFNRARHALGWPWGAGLHAWRRGFTNAYLERDLDARIELGLDTSGESLSMSLAQALGQESLGSQAAYVRDTQRRIRGSATYRDKEEHARLADENNRLRADVASLLKELAALDAKLHST
jgi:site-specific recombinase XerD